jgi:hypothetical protein
LFPQFFADPENPVEITITNYGLNANHQNYSYYPRSMAAKSFLEAIEAHERFNASAWEDPDPARPLVVFLEIDTLLIIHWPKFGGDYFTNAHGGKIPLHANFEYMCDVIDKVLASPAMEHLDSRLVFLLGEEDGPVRTKQCCSLDRNANTKLLVGHLSSHSSQVPPQDFGLPPWPVKSVSLSEQENRDIQECNTRNRKYLLSFQGRGRATFPDFTEYMMQQHQKDPSRVYASFGVTHYEKSNFSNSVGGKVLSATPLEQQSQDDYYSLMKNSIFCASPRGDKLYSVRFAEILSAGCIPVVYADGWVLPYNRDVVDWSEIAILVPQGNVASTMEALENISPAQICRAQQGILQFYNNYVKDSEGRKRAILRLVDANRKRGITAFSAAPGSLGVVKYS